MNCLYGTFAIHRKTQTRFSYDTDMKSIPLRSKEPSCLELENPKPFINEAHI